MGIHSSMIHDSPKMDTVLGLIRSVRCPGGSTHLESTLDEKHDNPIFPLGVSRSRAGRVWHSAPTHNTTPLCCPPRPPLQLHSKPQTSASQSQTRPSSNTHPRICKVSLSPSRLSQQAGVLTCPSRCQANLEVFSKRLGSFSCKG